MYRFALRMLGNDHDARDCVQEAFISAWRDLDRFEGRSSVSTWLLRLTHRRVIDLQRRRTPVPVEDDDLQALRTDYAIDPAQHIVADDLVEALQSALMQLGRNQRAAWLLREVEELSYDDIADALDITPGSVRGLLARARVTIAERMAPWR